MNLKKSFAPRLFAVFAALLLAVPAFPGGAQVLSRNPQGVEHREVVNYPEIPVSHGKKQILARLVHSTTFVAIRDFYDTLYPGSKISYFSSTRTAAVKGKNLDITFRDGSRTVEGNGRVLYTDIPVTILGDGRMYAPVRLLAKTLSLDVLWEDSTRSVKLSGDSRPLVSGKYFYSEKDLYWLSRIISAESRGESLLGQIAVGNVVMNRVRSPLYPSSVYGVIFDRKNGVQFSPVLNGTIYNKPYRLSVLAAKIVLEGDTLSDKILFFYDPKLSTNSWIGKNRPFAFRIGCHHFHY